jgi:hypothetical protein
MLGTITGLIRRRILVNFRVRPEVIQPLLPGPFRPKLFDGWAIAGICLIRLEQIRPSWLNIPAGLCSENAAHRIAVEWSDQDGTPREGVYIPQRHTDSLANLLLGGRLFPGEHQSARFTVTDENDEIDFRMVGAGETCCVAVKARSTDHLPAASIFKSLSNASKFFENGSLGYSETTSNQLDGLILEAHRWEVQPLEIESVQSTYFADPAIFPDGSIQFDCALLMRDIPHVWRDAGQLEKSACVSCA